MRVTHLTDEQVTLLARGRRDELGASVCEHAQSCPSCQARVAAEREWDVAIGDALSPDGEASRRFADRILKQQPVRRLIRRRWTERLTPLLSWGAAIVTLGGITVVPGNPLDYVGALLVQVTTLVAVMEMGIPYLLPEILQVLQATSVPVSVVVAVAVSLFFVVERWALAPEYRRLLSVPAPLR